MSNNKRFTYLLTYVCGIAVFRRSVLYGREFS